MPKLSSVFCGTPGMPLWNPFEKHCLKKSFVLHYLRGCVEAGCRSCNIVSLTPCEVVVGDETSAELEVSVKRVRKNSF